MGTWAPDNCPSCGARFHDGWNWVGNSNGGVSIGKAALGAIIAGPVGAVLGGISGKDKYNFYCSHCGFSTQYDELPVNFYSLCLGDMNGNYGRERQRQVNNRNEELKIKARQIIDELDEHVKKLLIEYKQEKEVAIESLRNRIKENIVYDLKDIDYVTPVSQYSENSVIDEFDTVKFGHYVQNEDGSNDDLEWVVLDKKEDRILLLCRNIIGASVWGEKDSTWSNSEIRRLLNEEMYEEMFSEEEKKLIIESTLSNSGNSKWESSNNNNTKDKIFCLNMEECEKYFPDEYKIYNKDENANHIYYINRKLATYANMYVLLNEKYFLYASGKEKWYKGNSYFWTRSLSTIGKHGPMAINEDGSALSGDDDYILTYGIRPAVWIRYNFVKKEQNKDYADTAKEMDSIEYAEKIINNDADRVNDTIDYLIRKVNTDIKRIRGLFREKKDILKDFDFEIIAYTISIMSIDNKLHQKEVNMFNALYNGIFKYLNYEEAMHLCKSIPQKSEMLMNVSNNIKMFVDLDNSIITSENKSSNISKAILLIYKSIASLIACSDGNISDEENVAIKYFCNINEKYICENLIKI